jgi:hypothetical protein
MHGQIVLTPLARTSPTLWSHMRLCSLRGAFASSRAVDRWILHDPRAWLGTAFHKVMEASRRPSAAVATLEEAWAALDRQLRIKNECRLLNAACKRGEDGSSAGPIVSTGAFSRNINPQYRIRPGAGPTQCLRGFAASFGSMRPSSQKRPDVGPYKDASLRRPARQWKCGLSRQPVTLRPAQPWLPSTISISALQQAMLPKDSHDQEKTPAADAHSRRFVRHSGLGWKRRARAAFPTPRLQAYSTG